MLFFKLFFAYNNNNNNNNKKEILYFNPLHLVIANTA